MKGLLLYAAEDVDRNAFSIRRFQETGAAEGIEVQLLVARPGQEGQWTEPGQGKIAINRSRDIHWTKHLIELGYRVWNPEKIQLLGNDKRACYAWASGQGIPCLQVYERQLWGKPGLWESPKVVKSIHGHGGHEVFLVKSRQELEKLVSGREEEFLLQEFCSEPGKDLRIYVMGREIYAAMLRTSDRDFRSNFSLGGHCQVHTLTGEEKDLAERVIRALDGPGYYGVDFLYHEGHPVLGEIEDAVGARMLYGNTDLDPIGDFVGMIKRS